MYVLHNTTRDFKMHTSESTIFSNVSRYELITVLQKFLRGKQPITAAI